IILISIIGTFIVAYISYVLNRESIPETFISIWNVWDTQHYLNIAKEGYSSSTVGERHLLIAFFPLFPLLTKLFSFVFQNYLLSALIISNIAYGLAVFYLYKLVRLDFERDDALRTAIYFSIFPTAYFLHAAYTESLFLALTIASFYYARNGKWALCGVIGMLAAMTRITGILLLPVLLIEYLHQKEFKKENVRTDILWIFVIGFGLLIYLIINYVTYGDPLKFLEIQSGHWGMHLSPPTTGFLNSWNVSNWGEPNHQIHGGWVQIIFGLLGLVLTIYAFFRIRLSYSLYALVTWLIVTSTSLMISVPRFILTIFPIFIVLAIFGRKKWANYAIIFISLMLYSLFLSQFVLFRWAF
ncbi:MAG: glycosyltransferase family 39 protein, partial [Thermodesulfobacteriota bacterium]